MQKPIIAITLAYVAGLLLGHGFLYSPAAVAALIVLALLSAAICSFSGLLSRRRLLLLHLPCALGMAAIFTFRMAADRPLYPCISGHDG